MGTAKLTFGGAARGVTGSNYHLEIDGVGLVIDCGTFQGGVDPDAQNRRDFPYDPERVAAAVLTHGHLDHVGRLPLLHKRGFAGPVLGHAATLEIGQLIMEDCAKLGLIAGNGQMYSNADVDSALADSVSLQYGQKRTVGPFTVQIFDAGHILGSSSVRVSWDEAGHERAIMFSGDLGVEGTPIIRDPNGAWEPEAHRCDFVVTESTYGSRNHPGRVEARQKFRDAVMHAVSDGGKVLIPAFAIGRTQEVLYELNSLVESGELAQVPVIVDGPLGLDATKIYEHHKACYDEEALELINSGDLPLDFTGLFGARRGRSSDAVKEIDGPAIIVAGSGMCSGGRIRGYLKEYLHDPRTDVIFVGYQAHGTLGRELQRGDKRVSVDGETIDVGAVITTISGLSAHADRDGLARWFNNIPRTEGGAVFVCHGEEKASRAYGRLLKDRFGARAIVPALDDTAALALKG
jgi:metallo-beta-lactamase family protein